MAAAGGEPASARRPGRDARGAGCRFRLFGGKGGVGKTTCAAAAALNAAESGRRVLTVSTDPAHSLGDALGRRLSPAVARVPTRRGELYAVELDAERALSRWLGQRRAVLRTIAERGTYLDGEDIDRLFRLAPPGVDELMGLLEVTRLAAAHAYHDVIVDAAPTGQALRLLAMPDTLRQVASVLDDLYARHRFVVERLGGSYVPGPADALIAEMDAEGGKLHDLLRDPARCRVDWVLLPERLAIEESIDAIAELGKSDLMVADIVVNRITPAPTRPCPRCDARRRVEGEALEAARSAFPALRLVPLPALPREPRGVDALRALGRHLARPRALPRYARRHSGTARRQRAEPAPRNGMPAWLALVAPASARLVLFLGKGGVGKTTGAAATALAVAAQQPGRRILLLSADPAHSLADALGVPVGDRGRRLRTGRGLLSVREPDTRLAWRLRRERHRDLVEMLFDSLRERSRLDAPFERRALSGMLDLAPQGLDEVFALLSIVDALAPSRGRPSHDTLVVDMPPTGHALRLLALPGLAREWVRVLLALLLKYRSATGLGELARDLTALSADLGRLDALLRDRQATRAVVVSRPAELPRRESERLIRGLRELGVTVSALLVDAVNEAPAGACPRCREIAASDGREVARLRARARTRGKPYPTFLAPAVTPPPRGIAGLKDWSRTWVQATG